MRVDQAVTLSPYRSKRAGRRFRPLLLLGLTTYNVLVGIGVTLLPPQLMFILAIPIAIGTLAVFWLLPSIDRDVSPTLMSSMLVIFVILNCLWPNYVALNVAGLPWINPARILTFALVAIALYAFSSSKGFRHEVAEASSSVKFVSISFWVYWGCTFIGLFMSGGAPATLSRWMNNQMYWTFFFLLSAWLAYKTNIVSRVAKALTYTGIVVSLEGIYEYHNQQVPWANHIPTWLMSDPALVSNILSLHARAGTNVYRATGTFNVSLVFAEYLSIAYPFLIHAAYSAKQFWQKLAVGFGMIAMLCAMWFTNARSGMIGFFMSVFLCTACYAFKHWRSKRGSLIGVSAMAMLPIGVMIFVALMFTWPRLHNMTIGGGQHEASSNARNEQWAMGIPKVESNPIGYGTSRSGGVLGFANAAGDVTVDTYYLTVLLEYGVVGLAAFLIMFAGQVVPGYRMMLEANTENELLIVPITVALCNFLVIKAVLSSDFNVPIAFMLLGFMLGMARKSKAYAPVSRGSAARLRTRHEAGSAYAGRHPKIAIK